MEENNNILISKKADIKNMTYYNKKPGTMKPPETQYDILPLPNKFPGEYVIFLDGTTYKALNGTTGAIDYADTAAHTVINAAITALTRGIIQLKTDVTLTAGITGKANVVLDCGRHVLTPATSFNIVTMKPGFQLRNFVFDVSGLTFTHACLFFDGADRYTFPIQGPYIDTVVSTGKAISAAQSGKFLHFNCDGASHWIAFVTVRDVHTFNFQYAYYLEASSDISSCWINENSFCRIMGDGDAYFIYMNRAANALINGNQFSDICYQDRATSLDTLTINGDDNYFQGRIWDKQLSATKAVVFNALSNENLVQLQKGLTTWITNGGTNNMVFMNHAQGWLSDAAYSFFQGSLINQYLYVYGAVGGVDKYIRMGVQAGGDCNLSCSLGQSLSLVSDTYLKFNPSGLSDIRCFSAIASALNRYLDITGRNAANNANGKLRLRWGTGALDYGVISTDTGDLFLLPTTNVVGFGTYTAGAATSAGYITIKDSGGTIRKLMVGT